MEIESIEKRINSIKSKIGNGIAINALSGGVDSSVVTALAKEAIGDNLITYFIDTGFMREKEPENVVETFGKIGINVKIYDVNDEFFKAVEGLTDGEEKRKAFSDTFYKVFGEIIKKEYAKYLFQGTIKADKVMFDKGQSQHNVRTNVRTNSDYSKFGIESVIEPLVDLYKSDVREVGKKLGLPEEIFNRPPFPGPGLLLRVIKIVEEELLSYNPSQCLACLANDTATGMIGEKAPGKNIIYVRTVKTKDFMTAEAILPNKDTIKKLSKRITGEIPGVVRVLYEITGKPPGTIEYI